jgi:hypothetical protein
MSRMLYRIHALGGPTNSWHSMVARACMYTCMHACMYGSEPCTVYQWQPLTALITSCILNRNTAYDHVVCCYFEHFFVLRKEAG